MSYLDWPAAVTLILAYFIIARHPKAGALVIAVADALWTVYALATWQPPLLAVSVICGALSLRAWWTWKAEPAS